MGYPAIKRATDTGQTQMVDALNKGPQRIKAIHPKVNSRAEARQAAFVGRHDRPAPNVIALASPHRPLNWAMLEDPQVARDGRHMDRTGLVTIVSGSAMLWTLLISGFMLLQ